MNIETMTLEQIRIEGLEVLERHCLSPSPRTYRGKSDQPVSLCHRVIQT